MKPVFNYCLKVWLTALLIAPFLWLLFASILTTRVKFSSSPVLLLGQFSAFIVYMVIFGAIASIPSFLLLYLSAFLLSRRVHGVQIFKYILSFLGVLFSLIPLLVIALSTKNLSTENLVMCSSYPMMIVAGIWYFKVNTILKVIKTEIVN